MLERIRDQFATGIGQITAYLPNLLSGAVILLVGYLVSRGLASVVLKLLGRAGIDRFVARHLDTARAGAQPSRSASKTTSSAVFWLGMLVTFSLTAQALRLAGLSSGINGILGYVPRVIVAALIVGVAIPVARVLAEYVRGAGNEWFAKGVRVVVIALAAFMALDQLGVASNIVNAGFIAAVAAAAAALAIAFGVGSIDVVREYAQQRRGAGAAASTSRSTWATSTNAKRRRSRAKKRQAEEAAEAARSAAAATTPAPSEPTHPDRTH
ncbi:MAG: hypothetical protein QM765_21640 [Myxococcales bacterium]